MPESTGTTTPASLVPRIVQVLRAVATHDPAGCSTSTVARVAALPRPTAHRILTSLAEQGLLDRDEERGHWHLGPELYVLGNIARPRYDITRHASDSLHKLARESGESAFLSVRRRDETVCLIREEGSFPIRSSVLFEGARFPLGVVSPGLAILSFLDEAETEKYLARANLASSWGEAFEIESVRERIATTRSEGYAVSTGLIADDSWGISAVVFNGDGQPEWALTLTGIYSRFRDDRRRELGRLLLDEAHLLSTRIHGDALGHAR